MKLEFSISARKINGIMKAIRAVGDDCVLNISDAGIKIRMIDPSNAAMVVVDMAPGSFDAFDADEGDIALDTREVLEKTSTFDDDTVLKISWDGYNKRLIVEGEGAKYGIYTIAPSATRKVPTIPNLDLPLEIEIDAARLRKMIKRAGLVSDHIMMGYTPELEFFVSSEGALDMLEPMAKIANELVNIRLGRDLPLIMLFALEDVDITYLLAPRIEKANGTPEA
jgi:DNA polymerase III sliding clamp (beta) subunit (PCNA family)